MSSTESFTKKRYFTPKLLVQIAMLSAVAVVLMLFDFPLPFLPPFYKLDFSEVVVLIGGFAFGPLAAVIIEFLKIILNLLFNSTDTFFVGEIANFLIGCSFVVPAAIVYKKHKTKKAALKGLILGTIVMIIVGGLMNAFILLPVYSWAYKMPLEGLIEMGSKLNGNINELTTFVLFATTPLNLIKGILSSSIVLLIYKRLSTILKHD